MAVHPYRTPLNILAKLVLISTRASRVLDIGGKTVLENYSSTEIHHTKYIDIYESFSLMMSLFAMGVMKMMTLNSLLLSAVGQLEWGWRRGYR